jgi:transcriptional repressor NF-X1
LCHAPGSCQETEPCTATVVITCSCGRIRQSVRCGHKLSNPSGGEGDKTLTCTNECAIAKRNARLAEALGISSERADRNKATYRDELTTFARANSKFIPVVEKSFAEYGIFPLRSPFPDVGYRLGSFSPTRRRWSCRRCLRTGGSLSKR